MTQLKGGRQDILNSLGHPALIDSLPDVEAGWLHLSMPEHLADLLAGTKRDQAFKRGLQVCDDLKASWPSIMEAHRRSHEGD